MGRVSQIATRKDGASAWVDIANPVAWRPWGGIKSLAFANGLTASFDVDKDTGSRR